MELDKSQTIAEDDDVVIIEEIFYKRSSTDLEGNPSLGDLSRALECPVCLEIPFGPIVMCHTGHSVCRPCAEEVKVCPTCESNFSTVRCLTLESVVNILTFQCPNRGEGCKENVTSAGFRKHCDTCPYRDIICNEPMGTKCLNSSVRFSKYLSHLQQYHKVKVATTAAFENNIVVTQSIVPPISLGVKSEWQYSCIQYDNITFLEKSRITGSTIYWYVCALTDKLTASNYRAVLVLTEADSGSPRLDKKEKTTWNTPVLSARDVINENSPEAAVYPLNDLMKLCTRKTSIGTKTKYSWQLEVTIIKKMGCSASETVKKSIIKAEESSSPKRSRVTLPRRSKSKEGKRVK